MTTSESFNQAVGKFLAKRRKALRLTQTDVAYELGLTSSQFISNIERGLAPVPVYILRKIVKMYKIDPKVLIELLTKNYKKMLYEQLEVTTTK